MFGNWLQITCANCCSFCSRIQQAGNEAYGLALSLFSTPSVGAACACFLELLGLDSLKLRVDVKVANMIFSYRTRHEDSHHSQIRESLGKGVFSLLSDRVLCIYWEEKQRWVERCFSGMQ